MRKATGLDRTPQAFSSALAEIGNDFGLRIKMANAGGVSRSKLQQEREAFGSHSRLQAHINTYKNQIGFQHLKTLTLNRTVEKARAATQDTRRSLPMDAFNPSSFAIHSMHLIHHPLQIYFDVNAQYATSALVHNFTRVVDWFTSQEDFFPDTALLMVADLRFTYSVASSVEKHVNIIHT